MTKIDLKKNVRSRNQQIADANRQRFAAAKTRVLNIMSSPGAGKTSLLEQMAPRLLPSLSIFVIEGDCETERDADRLRGVGLDALQIQTHGACHLDAIMIEKALDGIDLPHLDLLIVENVGNLICPTGFDLGEDLRVVVASTTEGDDKPLKYPEAYHHGHVCVLNKIDLLEHVTFDVPAFEAGARRANSNLRFFHASCTTGQGLDQWCHWLMAQHNQLHK